MEQHFCGRRGGLPFKYVTRPSFATKKCPEGTMPCSDVSTPENTVCYAKEDLETSCPITSLNFIKMQQPLKKPSHKEPKKGKRLLTDYKSLKGDEVYAAKDKMMIVPAKRTKDSLPLTSFKVEDKPCALPSEVSISPNSQFYPLEKERDNYILEGSHGGCTLDKVSNMTHDERY